MSETEKTGGPAFPVCPSDLGSEIITGMTILDYFAAEAMNGLCQDGFLSCQSLSKNSYDIAEAMILEREKRCRQKL